MPVKMLSDLAHIKRDLAELTVTMGTLLATLQRIESVATKARGYLE